MTLPNYESIIFKKISSQTVKHPLRKDLAKFCALYTQYGKDSVLLGALAYNCGPGVVNKSSILKKLKAGDRNIFKAYASHCRYKGKWHKGIHTRRLTELAALFTP